MQWPSSSTLNLKFCLINAENLFLLFDQRPLVAMEDLSEKQWQKLSTSVYDNKPLHKTLALAKALKEIDADIFMLCEVGGQESLKNFNEYFLNDAYSCCLIEGNSDRNIDVAFLVRKGLPFYFDLLSNKNRPIQFLYPHERQSLQEGYPLKAGLTQSHKFSRDVAELHLFTQDKEKPFLILLLTHLKSRLDPERIDPNGFERRRAELRTLVEIYQELEVRRPGVPVLVAGDMNGFAGRPGTDEEFRWLYEHTDLEDVLEVAQLPAAERATFYQVRGGSGGADGRQIDFAFLSARLRPFLKAGSAQVYRYKGPHGLPHDTPQSLDAKLLLPSDHYPLIFELTHIPVQI